MVCLSAKFSPFAMETPSLDVVRFGPYEVRPATREVFRLGIRVKLPPQAFEVMRVLLERKGELVTRQEFHRILWSADTFVDFDQGLNNAIKRIREVLNDSPESPRYIETLPRLGYRFIGEVDSGQSELTAPATENGSLPAPEQPATAEPEPVPETLIEAPVAADRRKPLTKSLLAVAAVIGLLAVAWLLRPHYPKPRITGVTQLTADGIPKWGPLATDGLRVYFTEVVNGRETIAAVPVTGGQAVALKLPFAQTGLYGISPDKADLLVAETPDMQQEAPLWRVPIIGGTPRRLGNISAHDATWSPDGKKLAYTVAGGLYIANADGSDPQNLVPWRKVDYEWAWGPRWSPDSRRLRFDYYNMESHGSHIWEVNVDGTNLHPLFPASTDWPLQASGNWTPDGKYFTFTAWNELDSGPMPASNLWAVREKVDLLHRNSGLPVNVTSGPTRYFIHTPSIDGKTIFALGSQRRAELMRYDTHTHSFALYASGLSAEGVSFSRDGAFVAYIKFPQGELWRSRSDGSEPLQLTSRPLFASTPMWSPDGKQIAFAGILAGQQWNSYVVSAAGGEPRRIDRIGETSSPSWSPDGNSLVFEDELHSTGMIRILNLKTGNVVPVPGSRGFMGSSMSPDGRWILALSNNVQSLLLFDRRTQAWREAAHAQHISWQRWSHDSRYVYFACQNPDSRIMRVDVDGGIAQVIVSLKDPRTTGIQDGWFSLTPNDEVLMLRDTGGGSEIYALSWDAP